MASTRRRTSFIAGVAAVAALLALPSLASATVYCVDVIGGDCQIPQPDFQTALNAAKANAGDDTVRLGPMTYTTATPLNGFNYVGGDGAVAIVGSGQGQTTLTVAAQPDVFAVNEILVVSHAGSSVSDLTITLPTPTPPNANVPQYRGIDATGLSVSDVTINGSNSPTNGFGIIINSGAIRDTTMDLPTGVGSPPMTGIASSGATTIEDSSITSDTAVRASGSGSLTVRRTSLRVNDNFGDGLWLISGSASLESSTIDLGSLAGADGIDAGNPNNNVAETVALTADHLTIGNGGSNTNGVRLFANDPSAADNNSATLTNTVISGPTAPIRRTADNGDTANVTTDYSNYNGAANVSTSGTTGAGAITETNLTNHAPGFVDAAAGDFHLLATSALIDIGDPAPPPPGALDIDGNPREILGKDGCAARRDIGADEFVPLTPPTLLDCQPPNTSILTGPSGTIGESTPTFTFDSTELGSTFQCSLDGGPFTPCSSPFTTSGLADGFHTFAVKAIDASLNEDPTPATRSFTVATAPPPPLDTTPPETAIGSHPKAKTKKRTATFTFTSSEPGAAFICSYDGKSFVPCTSPFTTPKLKRGKHRFDVLSTDSVGNRDQSTATFRWKVVRRTRR